jgi:gliding motility-associated-like protein
VLILPTTSASYQVSATNEYGCTATATTQVTALTIRPNVTITPAADTLRPGQSVTLLATPDPSYSYQWSPAAGLDATNVPNPTATPTTTTLYTVTVTDANGCTNTATARLVVFDSPCLPPYIFVPTAFTPNGDQLNDVLEVKGNVIEALHLVIYNRWGEQVFESRSQSDTWDGTHRGTPLPPDVYGYYLEVGCYGGEVFVLKGNVTLLR